ncbi:prolyl oligopeptidase family serine peptidase [Marinicella sp. S1101]|uniref:S9 family peptidase n=1 Tax=Marinicella marina TaxID=2996016 RepID=UPI002260A079|nr:prolyl oligopeptidase family serine peptidase [Marinicella marina]MCX7553594.1 prolyl oligopeptidase family serine peptidase [Marinicella marina]MDJ1140218.1 prolyl oligopeptidase family serine peptidase [Marinicella marina]
MTAACQSPSQKKQTDAVNIFNLDALYADQSIIGTTPVKPAWSSDGVHLAFLWNDEGFTFRDVWSYSTVTGEKRQLTHKVDEAALEQKIAGGEAGISEVVWLNAAEQQFLYVLHGQLYSQKNKQNAIQLETDKKTISNLALDPQGKQLAFISEGSLWLRPVNTAAQNAAISLASGLNPKAPIVSFKWAKDGQSLAYQINDYNPLPERDIHYYTADGAIKDRVTRAFPGDETAEYHLGMVNVDGNKTTFERPNASDYIWHYGISADGQSVFINSSDLLIKNHTIYVFDTQTANRQVFYHEYDPKHLRPDWQVAWAPDDEGLIILSDRDGYLHLYHQKTAAQQPVQLTSGEWEIASFAVSQVDKRIYFIANKSYLSERQIYSVALTDTEIKRVSPTTPGTHEFYLSPAQNFTATLFSNDATPLELYVIDLQSNESKQITHSPLPAFDQYTWADISYIEFPSHLDGTNLVGRLSLPADYNPTKKYPLIVGSVYSDSVRNQYGGRTSHPTWGLDKYLVSKGYIILNVNVRGSWGQGRKHNQGLRYGYGVIDIEDLHSGVKYLISEGMVSTDRVGIWGSSYGGLMTMMSLFKKPGVYAAGIAGAPATNVAHAYPGQMWVMGEPTGDDQPDRYQNQSPLYHTDGLVDPLMIIHGSKDPVVLYSDTIAVIEKLIEKQQIFELVTLPGTSHGWDAEGNDVRLFSFKKMVEFFDRHLKR